MHDPLCFEFDNKDDDCFDHSLESPFCFCELIAKVRSDERKEAEAFYTNDCFLCGYAGEWSTSMCCQCELEQ